jgi:hypothetical protein
MLTQERRKNICLAGACSDCGTLAQPRISCVYSLRVCAGEQRCSIEDGEKRARFCTRDGGFEWGAYGTP